MSTLLQRVTILLTTTIWLRMTVSGCPAGWFGKTCSYKCHCRNSISCYMNGSCPDNGPCATGFFGPSCQYVDLVSTEGAPSNPSFVRDGDENTCNPDAHSTSISVTLRKHLHVTWFRVHFKQGTDKTFNIILNNWNNCDNKREFNISATILDVTCDTNILLSRLQLQGGAAADVCSVYISGGRNVALKQESNQSTTYYQGVSGLAVDGNTDADFNHGSCSHTRTESRFGTWFLHLRSSHFVARLIILNRIEFQARLQGFTLRTFRENGVETYNFTDISQPAPTYDIVLPAYTNVSIIKITSSPTAPDRILTLCEVEAYGEILCPPQTYGIDCSGQCTCDFVQTCNHVTGACGPGCRKGRYGFNCSQSCNDNCKYGDCHEVTGKCLQCNPGYKGSFCSEMCAVGTFGDDCSMNCSKNCDNICAYDNGRCVCNFPFTGLLCTECLGGKFGDNCTKPCSPYCRLNRCHFKTGVCMSCVGGRIGPFCEDCPEGYYGAKCYTKCSKYCLNGTCDKHNGTCQACTEGFTGPLCRGVPTPSVTVPKWMWYILALPSLAIIICCFLLLRRRPNPNYMFELEASDRHSTDKSGTMSTADDLDHE